MGRDGEVRSEQGGSIRWKATYGPSADSVAGELQPWAEWSGDVSYVQQRTQHGLVWRRWCSGKRDYHFTPQWAWVQSQSRSVGFLRQKISGHVFLRKGSKAVGPGSCVDECDM